MMRGGTIAVGDGKLTGVGVDGGTVGAVVEVGGAVVAVGGTRVKVGGTVVLVTGGGTVFVGGIGDGGAVLGGGGGGSVLTGEGGSVGGSAVTSGEPVLWGKANAVN